MVEKDPAVFTLQAPRDGERVDRFMADALPDLSRVAVQRLIAEEEVLLNGEILHKPAYKTHSGDEIVVHVPPPRVTTIEPQDLPLSILYEDSDILVVNKAAGMVVHPGAGNPDGTLVNAVLAHCPDLAGVGGEIRPGIVHRLDKDTSGVLVVAKHDKAIRLLQQQFKRRTVKKHYVALLRGNLEQDEGLIDAPIGRHPVNRKKMAVRTNGKISRTRWLVLERFRDARNHPYTWVEVNLLTGRTHQIRVHFTWLGYPLVGDAIYGGRNQPLSAPRQCLHARDLSFVHPVTEELMTFSAPIPTDLVEILDKLREQT